MRYLQHRALGLDGEAGKEVARQLAIEIALAEGDFAPLRVFFPEVTMAKKWIVANAPSRNTARQWRRSLLENRSGGQSDGGEGLTPVKDLVLYLSSFGAR